MTATVPAFKCPSNEEMKPIWKDILKIEERRIRKSSHACAKDFFLLEFGQL
jgi:hypothetical protein